MNWILWATVITFFFLASSSLSALWPVRYSTMLVSSLLHPPPPIRILWIRIINIRDPDLTFKAIAVWNRIGDIFIKYVLALELFTQPRNCVFNILAPNGKQGALQCTPRNPETFSENLLWKCFPSLLFNFFLIIPLFTLDYFCQIIYFLCMNNNTAK